MTNPALLQFLLSKQFTFPTWKEKNSLKEEKKQEPEELNEVKKKKKVRKHMSQFWITCHSPSFWLTSPFD